MTRVRDHSEQQLKSSQDETTYYKQKCTRYEAENHECRSQIRRVTDSESLLVKKVQDLQNEIYAVSSN